MNIPGMNRPARAGGFLLIGVAVIATAIGTASAVSNDDGPDTATPGDTTRPPTSPNGAPTTTTTPDAAPTTTTSRADGANGTTAPSTGADSEPSTGANGEDGTPGAPEDSEQVSVKSVPVRVYNNSTVKNLASRAAEDLRENGWTVAATGNYSKGTIPTTTAYFRSGTDEEAAARALAEEFGMRTEPRFEGIAKSSPGVIVIVTKDYQDAPKGK